MAFFILSRCFRIIPIGIIFVSCKLFCQQQKETAQRKAMVYISENCTPLPVLKTGDTVIVKLARVMGNGENWTLKSDTTKMRGIIFLDKGPDPKDQQEDGDGGVSHIEFVFLMSSRKQQTLQFEYGRLWEKNFKPSQTCSLDLHVE